jgi:CheY-like chemotaxis protein
MDLTLPRMSGVEVAEELRKSDGFAQTVIVAISGYGADQIPQPSPFDGHLTKPVELDRLLRLMADRPRGEATPP